MSDTTSLLNRISALRQRLEQQAPAPGPAEAVSAVEQLRQQAAAGQQQNELLNETLRQMTAEPAAAVLPAPAPAQLTARAHRLLEHGQLLLEKLRLLAEALRLGEQLHLADERDPLQTLYRDTAAMTETALRMVPAFPSSPSAQFQLCAGVEAILAVAGERILAITAVLAQRRRTAEQIDGLAEVLTALHLGRAVDLAAVMALAEALLAEADQGQPLRFLQAPVGQPARFVAAHALTVTQVAARVLRHDADWRGRPLQPLLAALLHDAGMLRVPAEVLAQPGPLNDTQRRAVESHAAVGAELAARLLPAESDLLHAVAAHHERLDGTGYPDGLRGPQLSSLARLLSVCDVYAAYCVARPHRPARETRTALTDTLLLAEDGALDRDHAEHLLQLSFYPAGSVIELADGAVGVVVASHLVRRDLNLPARPVVAVLTDAQGQPLPAPRHLDLAQCEGHSIVRVLPAGERRQVLGRHYPQWAA